MRAVLWLAALLVAISVVGGGIVAFVPRNGQALQEHERLRLLEQAGLPEDFPVHPYARRMTQPAQGGISYSLAEPVPDVLLWQRDQLERGGYRVFDADVAGQDEYLPHWLYFQNGSADGAIIIRPVGVSLWRTLSGGRWGGTEVKILSTSDSRLALPPLPESGRK